MPTHVSSDTSAVVIPIGVARTIADAFLPRNPNRATSCSPKEKDAVRTFFAAISRGHAGVDRFDAAALRLADAFRGKQ